MGQHDYTIADDDGTDFLADVNAVLQAIVTANSGTSEPNPRYALMPWYDETNQLLLRRNFANNGWIVEATLSGNDLIPFRDGPALKNALVNGAFDVWQSGTSISGITTRTYAADMWAVQAAGAAIEAQQSTSVPGRSRYSLNLVGASGVTTVDVDQRIEAAAIAPIKRVMTFSASVYNATGAAFTPKLFVSTPAAADDWTTPTVRNGGGSGEDLQSCADSAWTQVTWTGDVSGYTNIDNGLEVRLQLPSGALGLGDQVRVAEVQLEPGRAATPIETLPPGMVLHLCQRHFWRWAGGVNKAPFGTVQVTSATGAIGGSMDFPAPMRAIPTVAAQGGWVLTSVSGTALSVTSITPGYVTSYGCGLSDVSVASGLGAAGTATVVFSTASSVLTFDARL